MNQSTLSALAIASRFSTLAGSAPISSFLTGTSIFLPDSVRGIAAQRVLVGAGAFRVDHRQARVAPPLVEMRVVRDRQHPHQQVSTLVELMPVGERTFQGCLHQIIGRRRVEHQRARIAAQARDHPEQLLAEDVVGLH